MTPDSSFCSILLHIKLWEKERDVRSSKHVSCLSHRAKECWQVLTMLSVSAPDKSAQFINKIDGIAYRQFLLRVFPCKSRSQKHQKHPCCLTSSYPVCQSPGMLKALNASCVQLSIRTTAGTIGVFHGWHRNWTVNNQMTL